MNSKDLKSIIVDLKSEARISWIKTKGLPLDEVQRIKELKFIPIVDKLLFIGLNSIEYKDETIFLESLAALTQLYELALRDDLGYNGSIKEWIKDKNGRPIKAQNHLSYSVPAKEVFIRFGILATFSVKQTAYKFLRYLCEQKIEIKNEGGLRKEFIFFCPLYNYNSGEGTLTSLFDESREMMNNNKVLFDKYFDSDSEAILNYQIEADFLIEVYYFTRNISKSWFDRFLNFPRFHIVRLYTIFDRVFRYPEDLKDFAQYTNDNILELFQYTAKFSSEALRGYLSDWNFSGTLKELRERYLPQK